MRKVGLVVVILAAGCGAADKAPPASPARGALAEMAPAQPGHSAPAGESVPAAAARGPMSGSDAKAPAAKAPPAPPPAPSAGTVSPTTTPDATSPIAPMPPPERLPQAGQVTAGIWDDNLNFDFWKPYAVKFTQRGLDFKMFTDDELEAAKKDALQSRTPKTELDVQLVLDTTGSMGDELSYLQSELDAIAAQLKIKFPKVTPRWSLVVYRDHGDEYVTRAFDFTSDTDRFRTNLRAQAAAGGGDTPEAVVEGLGKGLAQKWRTEANVARIAFWVADAPAHPGEGQKLAGVLRDAKKKGVHVYPVASSDTDETAEYQMRAAAQITGGRYVFLTNDSGIGNSHAEPHIPCYNVTRLDHALVRMISVELSGRFVDADPRQVIRTVGKPDKEGKCRLSSGMLVASY